MDNLIHSINHLWPLGLSQTITQEQLREKLIDHINYLINHDFDSLVSLLYRIDVNETTLRNLLKQPENDNTAALIADLIIQRQWEKIKSREIYSRHKKSCDEENW